MLWNLRDGVARRQVILCIVIAVTVNGGTSHPAKRSNPSLLNPTRRFRHSSRRSGVRPRKSEATAFRRRRSGCKDD